MNSFGNSFENRFERIMKLMMQHFRPIHLALRDISDRHADHYGGNPNGESHFQLIVESPYFVGMTQVQMHQAIYRLLDTEFKTGLHAIAIHASPPKKE